MANATAVPVTERERACRCRRSDMIPNVRSDFGFGRAGVQDEGSSVHTRGEKAWRMLGVDRCGLARPVES
jgi:hypothetical protein